MRGKRKFYTYRLAQKRGTSKDIAGQISHITITHLFDTVLITASRYLCHLCPQKAADKPQAQNSPDNQVVHSVQKINYFLLVRHHLLLDVHDAVRRFGDFNGQVSHFVLHGVCSRHPREAVLRIGSHAQ